MNDFNIDIKSNYIKLRDILASKYQKTGGYDFYRYIFPNNQKQGELNTDFSKPNAICLYKDDRDKGSKRRAKCFKCKFKKFTT